MPDPSDQFAVEYQLHAGDLAHYFNHTLRTAPGVRRRRRHMQVVGAIVLAAMIVYAMIQQEGGWADRLAAAGATIVVFLVVFGLVWLTMRLFNPRRRQLNDLLAQATDEQMLSTQSLALDADGVHLQHGNHRDSAEWADVRRVESDDRLIYLYVADVSAYIIPIAAFDSPDDAAAFQAQATLRMKAAVSG